MVYCRREIPYKDDGKIKIEEKDEYLFPIVYLKPSKPIEIELFPKRMVHDFPIITVSLPDISDPTNQPHPTI